MFVTYAIINKTNGKMYIGSSQKIGVRLDRHFRELEKGTHHCKPLQADFTNRDDYTVKKIVVETREMAYELEQSLINQLVGEGDILYNVGLGVKGGDNLTRNPARVEIVARMTASVCKHFQELSPTDRKRIYGRPGEQNGMFGKTHTPEVRKRLSEINLGKPHPWKGRQRDDDFKKKLREGIKNRDFNGDKNPFHGRHHSEETRKKLSDSKRGSVPVNVKKVTISGESYASITEAGRRLKIPTPTVLYRINSNNPKFSDWNFTT